MKGLLKQKKTKKYSHMYKNRLQLWSLCILPLIHVLIFKYLPMIGVTIAFKDYRYDLGILKSKWIGFKNFEYFFQSDEFFRITRNTLGMNLIFIALGTIAAIALAITYFELNSTRKLKVYQTIAITPNFISWVIVSYMVYAFLNPEYGYLNTFMEKLGGTGISWYSEPKYWPFILAIVYLWKHVGMSCVIYYATLMGIDSEIFEAAEIDGANKMQKVFNITIPSLIPVVTILTILNIGSIFNGDFGLFYQVPRNVGQLYETTDIIDTYVYRALRELGDTGMSSAVGLLQSFVGMILVITTNAVVKKIDPERSLF